MTCKTKYDRNKKQNKHTSACYHEEKTNKATQKKQQHKGFRLKY